VGRNSTALDVQYKSTSKSEIQSQCKASKNEIPKSDCISGGNAVGPCEQDFENGGGSSLSSRGKPHILGPEREDREILFRGINTVRDSSNERRENTDVRNQQTSSESESRNDEHIIFKCPNQQKIGRLLTILGPLFRVGTLEGSSWKEDYPKTPCYFVLPDSKPKWRIDASMSPLSYDNRFDSSGNNPTLVVEMIENESDRYHIAKSLNIEIRSGGLQKDYIHHDIMDIAQCGFNHIIIIGSCYCDLLFLDCYERVFRWDSMTDVLWFIVNFSKVVLEKP